MVLGGCVGGIAFMVPICALILYAVGSMDTLLKVGGGSAGLNFLGVRLTSHASDDAIGTSLTVGLAWWAWVLPLTVLTFLVASRAWRALPGRR